MAEKLTSDQEFMLRRIASVATWFCTPIDRSGQNKRFAAARQQLVKKGLIEGHEFMRRRWRATEAGRAALEASDDR
jgi:hypothetical protein